MFLPELITPERASVHTNCTFTAVLFHAAVLGAVRVTLPVGAVLSMLMPPKVPDAEFPAKSVQSEEADWPCRSAESVTAVGLSVATPETASVQEKVTVTFELFHPAAFGAGVREGMTVGAVLSM